MVLSPRRCLLWCGLFWVFALGSGIPVLAQSGAADTVEVHINAVAGLQYDRVRFQVTPEAVVRLQLTNTDAMEHNLVITSPGTRMEVVNAAAEIGPEEEFVPDMEEVLHFIPVIGSDSSYTLTFRAPDEPGVYPYVCTFPGHGTVMYGAMYVGSQELPPLAEDPHIPPQRRDGPAQDAGNLSAGHPYDVTLPAVYRTFMPESSPASIAVGLPGGESFCFDASFAFLRYAWSGGFIDNTEQWQGNGVAFSEILGTIYYRNEVGFPLRIGDPEQVPEVEFEGYRLVEGDYPEFIYLIDGAEVRERIEPRGEGTGLVRTFEIASGDRTVWFLRGVEAGVAFEASAGRWQNNRLELSPEAARQFTITMVQAGE